jgi:hypothetical protein
MKPQPKWTIERGQWVQRPMILTTNPFKENPASPGAAKTGEG